MYIISYAAPLTTQKDTKLNQHFREPNTNVKSATFLCMVSKHAITLLRERNAKTPCQNTHLECMSKKNREKDRSKDQNQMSNCQIPFGSNNPIQSPNHSNHHIVIHFEPHQTQWNKNALLMNRCSDSDPILQNRQIQIPHTPDLFGNQIHESILGKGRRETPPEIGGSSGKLMEEFSSTKTLNDWKTFHMEKIRYQTRLIYTYRASQLPAMTLQLHHIHTTCVASSYHMVLHHITPHHAIRLIT